MLGSQEGVGQEVDEESREEKEALTVVGEGKE